MWVLCLSHVCISLIRKSLSLFSIVNNDRRCCGPDVRGRLSGRFWAKFVADSSFPKPWLASYVYATLLLPLLFSNEGWLPSVEEELLVGVADLFSIFTAFFFTSLGHSDAAFGFSVFMSPSKFCTNIVEKCQLLHSCHHCLKQFLWSLKIDTLNNWNLEVFWAHPTRKIHVNLKSPLAAKY